MFVGNSRGLEASVLPGSGIAYALLPMASPRTARGLLLSLTATIRCLALVTRTRPRVTFATGGYVSAPLAVASWLRRVPLVLFLPDLTAGAAVARLAPLARTIAVSAPEAATGLPAEKVVVTGYPVRREFFTASRQAGRALFGIDDHTPVVTVFGGSQGARSINEALAASLSAVLPAAHVIHLAGERRMSEALAASVSLPEALRARYHLVPYLSDADMANALAAADVVIGRSGASVVGELPAIGVPAILVPLPDAKVHQQANADWLQRAGAALVIQDADLPVRLSEVLLALLADPARRERMAVAMRSLAQPQAAARIAALVQATAS